MMVWRQWLFSVLLLAISSEPLLYSEMKSLVSFPLIPKYMTLNNLEWLFLHEILFLHL